MEVAVLLLRLALAAVFLTAGIAKLRDPAGTRTAVVDFGAPRWAAAPLAVALPAAELAIAALLLFATTATWGAIDAIVLLVIFTAAVSIALARGRAPDCHCFGQIGAKPASGRTLVRNGVLIAMAGVVAVAGWNDPGPSAVGWIGDLDATGALALSLGAALALVVVTGGGIVTHILRSHGGLLLRIESLERSLAQAGLRTEGPGLDEAPEVGLPPGVPAPAFTLTSEQGEEVGLTELLAPGKPLLIVFTSPTCGPCGALMPTVEEWQRTYADTLTIAVASAADPDMAHHGAETMALDNLYFDPKMEAYTAFGAGGTPSAVLVAPDGTIASRVVPGAEWVERLVAQAEIATADAADGQIPVGDPVPDLTLTDLAGDEVRLDGLHDQETVLLFWNPDCGFCRDMHGDLRGWEERRNGTSPRLVVLSSGGREESAGEGFRSPVLLDGASSSSHAFGAGGTPTAVLVGGGRVRSRVVVGAPGVWALLAPERHLQD